MKAKTINFLMLITCFLFSSTAIFAQGWPDIPVSHDHSGGICWGYATVRAFHQFGDEDTSCNPATAHLTTLSGNSFFDKKTWYHNASKDTVQTYDIIVWEGGEDHAAFVVSVGYPPSYSNIMLDQYDNGVKTGKSLQKTIDGDEDLTARGIPTGYYRIKPKEFDLTLDNEMGNTNGSNDKVKLNPGGSLNDAPCSASDGIGQCSFTFVF